MNYREVIEKSIAHGAIPPYVYTYPTRSSYRELSEPISPEKVWREDFKHSPNLDLNLYIHVPFCRYKCGFCNLYTITTNDETVYDAYVDALCIQLERYRPIIEARNLRTIYIGGGTPSILSRENFSTIFTKITSIYPNWRNLVDEVCIEATPDSIVDTEYDLLKHFVDIGITRVNMGVQSLKKDELKEAGRNKAGRDIIHRAFDRVKSSGLSNLSTDLIMGFVGQSHDSWRESVEELCALNPDTISTYFLTVRPDAWFSRTGDYKYARDPVLYERYDIARKKYMSSGYVQETNIRYKKSGRGGYLQKRLQFQGVPYLGIGAGSRTYTNTVDYLIGGSFKPNVDQVWDYINAVRSDSLVIKTGFVYNDEERIRKRLVLDLFNLDLQELERYNISKYSHVYEGVFEAAVDLGLLQLVGRSRVQLTHSGYKYRDIISWLLFSEDVRAKDAEFYRNIHNANKRSDTMQDSPDAASVISAPL